MTWREAIDVAEEAILDNFENGMMSDVDYDAALAVLAAANEYLIDMLDEVIPDDKIPEGATP